jgi:tRNA(fMet)-specific endonuclease VapC
MRYLLDTNQIVHYLRQEQRVVDDLQSRKQEGLAVSVISVAELYEGVFRAIDPEAAEQVLRNFLSEVTVLPVDEEIGRVFGQERARLRQVGLIMSDLDLLIAATALHNDLTLLTADQAFDRVQDLNVIFSN